MFFKINSVKGMPQRLRGACAHAKAVKSNQILNFLPNLVSMNVKGTIVRICDIHHWPQSL